MYTIYTKVGNYSLIKTCLIIQYKKGGGAYTNCYFKINATKYLYKLGIFLIILFYLILTNKNNLV